MQPSIDPHNKLEKLRPTKLNLTVPALMLAIAGLIGLSYLGYSTLIANNIDPGAPPTQFTYLDTTAGTEKETAKPTASGQISFSGTPTPGVDVSAFIGRFNTLAGTTITDDKGTYSIELPTDETYTILFSLDDESPYTFRDGTKLHTTTTGQQNKSILNIELSLAEDVEHLIEFTHPDSGTKWTPQAEASPSIATGSVSTAGDPIADIKVNLFEVNSDGTRADWVGQTRTDANGRYAIEVTPNQTFNLTFAVSDRTQTFQNGYRWYEVNSSNAVRPLNATIK